MERTRTAGACERRNTIPGQAGLGAAAIVALLACFASACGDDHDYDLCRFDPYACRGGLGGVCRSTRECGVGFCCREPKECGGGMCTFECRSDYDCPVDMGCEHGVCFFACRSDYDCAPGQECGHGHTVCEW